MRGDANARWNACVVGHASFLSQDRRRLQRTVHYFSQKRKIASRPRLADVLHLESNQSFTPGIGRDKTPLADATTICHASGAPVLWCTNPRRVLLLLLLLLLLL